jgi:hypothetical protein
LWSQENFYYPVFRFILLYLSNKISTGHQQKPQLQLSRLAAIDELVREPLDAERVLDDVEEELEASLLLRRRQQRMRRRFCSSTAAPAATVAPAASTASLAT